MAAHQSPKILNPRKIVYNASISLNLLCDVDLYTDCSCLKFWKKSIYYVATKLWHSYQTFGIYLHMQALKKVSSLVFSSVILLCLILLCFCFILWYLSCHRLH